MGTGCRFQHFLSVFIEKIHNPYFHYSSKFERWEYNNKFYLFCSGLASQSGDRGHMTVMRDMYLDKAREEGL